MIATPAIQWSAIAPAIVLLGLACLLLLLSAVVSGARARVLSGSITIIGLVVTALISGWLWRHHPDWLVLSGQLRVDRFTDFVTILVCAAGVATVGIAWGTHRLDERIARVPRAAPDRGRRHVAARGLQRLADAVRGPRAVLASRCTSCAPSTSGRRPRSRAGSSTSSSAAWAPRSCSSARGSSTPRRRRCASTRSPHRIQSSDLGGEAILLLGIAMILGGLAFKASAAPFHSGRPTCTRARRPRSPRSWRRPPRSSRCASLMRVLTTAFGPAGDVWEGAVARSRSRRW